MKQQLLMVIPVMNEQNPAKTQNRQARPSSFCVTISRNMYMQKDNTKTKHKPTTTNTRHRELIQSIPQYLILNTTRIRAKCQQSYVDDHLVL